MEKIWNQGITVKGDLIPFDNNPGFPPLSRVGNSTFPFLEGHFGNLYAGNLFANDSGGTTRRVLLEGDTVRPDQRDRRAPQEQTRLFPARLGRQDPQGHKDPQEQTRLYQDRQVRRDPQDPRDHRERQGREVQLAHRVPQEATLLYLARKDLKALQARLDRRDPQERTRLWPARKDPQALLALLDPVEIMGPYDRSAVYRYR
eukprot:jgi/Tetstr1/460797/TSEL_005981.t1